MFKIINILIIDDLTYPSPVRSLNNLPGSTIINAVNTDEAEGLIRKADQQFDLVIMCIKQDAAKSSIAQAGIFLNTYDIPLIFLCDDPDENVISEVDRVTPYGCLSGNTTGTKLADYIEITLKLHKSYLKHKENCINERDDKYRVVFENVRTAIIVIEENTQIILANAQFESLSGYTKDEIEGKKSWTEFIVKEDLDRMVEQHYLRRNRPELALMQYEFRFIRKSGVIVDMLVAVEMIPGTKNSIASFMDITILKKAEERLRESESKYRELVQNANSIILRMDSRGNVTFFNEFAQKYFGFSEDEILGENVIGTIVPEFDSCNRDLEKFISDLCRDPEKYTFNENENIKKNGERVWISWTNKPILDDSNNVTGVLCIGSDITTRRQAEQALLESERRLSDIVQFFPDAILVIDNNGVIISWNSAMENLTGVKAEDILGKGDYEYSIPFYGARRAVLIDQVMSEDYLIQDKYSKIKYKSRALEAEGYVNNLPGGKKYLSGSAAALFNSNNEIIGAIEVLKDFTERKATELALQESERRLSDIIQFFPDAILVIDQDGRITAWNRAIEVMTGVMADEMLGKGDYEYALPFYGERRPILIDLAMKVDKKTEIKYTGFERSGSLITGEAYMPNLRGGQTYLFGTAAALYNSQGDLVGAIESIRDVTERRKAEELLIMEKERLAITLRSIGDGVIVTDISGNILLINNVAENLLGWNQSDIVNLPLMDYFYIIDAGTRIRNKDLLRRVIETGNVIELGGKIILINKAGREYIISESAAPVRDKDNNMIGIIIVFRDMTEKQKMENELLKTQKLESIGIIAGGIAHDFNNILTGIIGYISLARMLVRPEDRIYNMLSEVEKASLRATSLTQQLLTFSKGWAPIRKTVFISDLLKEAAAFVLSGSNIKCEFIIQDDLWPVEIDEGQIIQVINNLIINARQAMPDGGSIEIKAENTTVDFMKDIPLKGGRYLLLSIIDHGTGIPEEIQPKVFDPFFTTRVTGNGLGLSTSYSIIRKHDGYITLKSGPASGTTFYIYLPASEKKARLSNKQIDIQASRFKGRVLLMDDEEIIRKTATEMLNFFGIEVDTASDGNDAFKMFVKAFDAGRPYDLVFMDLTIPGGLGGKDAVKKFCELDPEIKVIVSSGYSNDPVLSDYKKYGFSGIVVKPYKMDDLYKQLNKFLG